MASKPQGSTCSTSSMPSYFYFFMVYMFMCFGKFRCTVWVQVLRKPEGLRAPTTGAPSSDELPDVGGLGIEPRSSARALSAFNY